MMKVCSRGLRRLAAIAAVVAAALGANPASAQAVLDSEALRLLHRMNDYMAGLNAYSVDTQNVLEVVLTSGQKLQFDSSAAVTLQRPNRLRAERSDELFSQVFFYDGATLTLYNPRDKVYATVPAPATIDQTLDFARDSLDVVAPAADLLYLDAYRRLTDGVTVATVVGKAVIGGVKCDHLAFSAPQIDWQIWIADGDKPLPRKFVITTKDVDGWPSYTVVMSHWNVAPALSTNQFRFLPAPGTQKIEFLKMTGQ